MIEKRKDDNGDKARACSIFVLKCFGISLLVSAVITMNPITPLMGVAGMFFGTAAILSGNAAYISDHVLWQLIIPSIAMVPCFIIGVMYRRYWFSYPMMILGFLLWMFAGIIGLGPA